MWWMIASAATGTWAPTLGGFVVPERSDAPTDARPAFYGDVPVTVWMDVDGEEPVELDTADAGESRWTHVVLPPDGGWPVGVPITLRLEAEGYTGWTPSDAQLELTFTAVEGIAPAPPTPEPLAPAPGDWVENTDHPQGCCADVRSVALQVGVPGADRWTLVQLVGDRSRELDTEVAVGGTARTEWVQWVTDSEAHEACVAVTAIGAGGAASSAVDVCAPIPARADTGDSGIREETKDACGCSTGGPGGWVGMAALLVVVGRRRRRSSAR